MSDDRQDDDNHYGVQQGKPKKCLAQVQCWRHPFVLAHTLCVLYFAHISYTLHIYPILCTYIHTLCVLYFVHIYMHTLCVLYFAHISTPCVSYTLHYVPTLCVIYVAHISTPSKPCVVNLAHICTPCSYAVCLMPLNTHTHFYRTVHTHMASTCVLNSAHIYMPTRCVHKCALSTSVSQIFQSVNMHCINEKLQQ